MEEKTGECMPINSSLKQGLTDVLLVVTVLVVVKQMLLPHTVIFAGPASTFTAMFAATYCLRRRGLGWRDLGFGKPENWVKTLLWSIGIFCLILLTAGLGGALADMVFEKAPRTNRFGDIEGDWGAFLMYLALIWTHAAFFEELLFRAFIISRLRSAFEGVRWAIPAAVVLAAAFFGYRHYYYQGMHGAVVTGLIGLSLGIYYVRYGNKNIWPLILGHGFIDTLGFTFRVLGIED